MHDDDQTIETDINEGSLDDTENREYSEEQIGEVLKKIKDKLKLCERERSEYLTGWQRAKADFINARKDEERQRMEFIKFASDKIAYDMLAVADSMEMALANSPPEWLGHLYAQLIEVFRRHGIVAIESVGQRFDPARHEAIQEEKISDTERDNSILEEYQKGYMMHDKILRPAKVKVGVYQQK